MKQTQPVISYQKDGYTFEWNIKSEVMTVRYGSPTGKTTDRFSCPFDTADLTVDGLCQQIESRAIAWLEGVKKT